MTRSGTVQSVVRTFELLEIIAESGGEIGLSELSVLVRLPPSSLHRLLQTCTIGGYIRQLPSNRYALGPGMIPLGKSAGGPLAQIAQPRLRDLVAQLGETASMGRLEGDHVVYVAQHASPQAMRMVTKVGGRANLHATSIGKAILTTMTDVEVLDIVRRTGMPPNTPRTLSTPEALIDDLATARSRGFALDEEEQELGVRCFAVALPIAAQRTTAICVSAPLDRTGKAFELQAVQELQRTAAQIAQYLTV